jgi:RNA polymerase sigma-70 factor (family 1)
LKILNFLIPLKSETVKFGVSEKRLSPCLMSREEKIIITAIARRNRDVFEALFCEYFTLLTKYAEGFIFDRDDCEDIVQNLFINLWERADSLDIRTSIKAYLYQSVKNRCLNYLRNLNVSDNHKLLYLESMLNGSDETDWIDPEWAERIHLALNNLPPQMAQALRLKYMEGEKIVRIARKMRISENTVKTHLTRGKKRLHKHLLESLSLYSL